MNCSYDLSLEEQKLILTLSSLVQREDEDFKPYKFKINEFMNLLGVDTKTKYTEIPKITKELMKKVFEIEEDDTIIQTSWLSSATYKKGSGMVELEFSPKLKSYMIKLNGLFTQYKLSNILSMKSKYSPRIYEILKCNEFKRKILQQTEKELDKLSDISFKFDEIKTGRKVTSLKFYIHSQKREKVDANKEIAVTCNQDAINIDGKIHSIIDLMKEKSLNYSEAKSIYKSANGDLNIICKVYNHFKNKTSENFVGLMIKMVQPGKFEEPKIKITFIQARENRISRLTKFIIPNC